MKTIMVYQMSKVGSSTVFSTIAKKLNLGSGSAIVCPKDNHLDDFSSGTKLYHVHHDSYFSEPLEARIKEGVDVITLMRDPVARNISGFFESPTRGLDMYSCNEENVRKLLHSFVEHFDHNWFSSWFDLQIRGVLGVDIFERNWQDGELNIVSNGQHRVLCMRTEDINSRLCHNLSKFLGIKFLLSNQDEIVHSNESKNRHNKDVFNMFRDRFSEFVPKEYADNLYRSKTVQHFYSRDEIDNFRSRWVK